MLGRLRAVGFDTDKDSFAFAEIVHRSAKRYDLKLDRRRMPPTSAWNPLSTAAQAWALPVLQGCDVQEELEMAVEGVLTSLPGAPPQRFHQDGPLEGSFNCFVPLVDVGTQKTGTEFWPGSHVHPAVPPLVLNGKLGVEDPSQLAAIAGDPNVHVVQPELGAGDMLLYQYRVIHRGPANLSPEPRPIYYCGFSDTAGAGDGYNFKSHRALADLERRRSLFGI
jgi:ectoine hydroxylase-related dioxygenase (phytanoyl-CoA dioxygenase family)